MILIIQIEINKLKYMTLNKIENGYAIQLANNLKVKI